MMKAQVCFSSITGFSNALEAKENREYYQLKSQLEYQKRAKRREKRERELSKYIKATIFGKEVLLTKNEAQLLGVL